MRLQSFGLFLAVIVFGIVMGALFRRGVTPARESTLPDWQPYEVSPPSGTGQSATTNTPSLDFLVGSWSGTAWQNGYGSFQATPPRSMDPNQRRQRDSTAEPTGKLSVQLDVEPAHVQIKGAEGGFLALKYDPADGEKTEERGMVQLKLVLAREADPGTGQRRPSVLIEGRLAELYIESLDGNELTLQGSVKQVGDAWLDRVVNVTLTRHQPDSDNGTDAGATPDAPNAGAAGQSGAAEK